MLPTPPPPIDDAYELSLPDTAEQARATEIQARLRALASAFSDNVVRATQSFGKHVTDEAQLAGIPDSALQRARRKAQAAGLPGALLTVDAPSYQAVLSSAHDRQLRKELYEARVTRASDRGPCAGEHDNGQLILEALALRHELGRLFGKDSYAELVVQLGSLIRSADDVERYLTPRARACKPRAQAELDALWAFARTEGVPKGFSMWDLPYYAARLRERELDICADEAALCVHFPLTGVLKGLFDASAQLLGLQIVPLTAATTSDADCYRVLDADGTELGSVELEVFSQPGQLEGARASLSPQGYNDRPSLRLQCDLEPPQEGALALLRPSEVQGLFRSWGQGLHRLLAAGASSTPAARHNAATAGLIAGSLFERLSQHPGTLQAYARHYQTGATLPPELLARLHRSQELQAGLSELQHLELALFDLRLHRDYVPVGKSTQLRSHVLDTLAQVRREVSVMPPPYWERMSNTLTRVFVDGRAARVWEELWATQAAANVFDALTASGFSHELTRSLRGLLWAPAGGLGVRVSDWLKTASAPAA